MIGTTNSSIDFSKRPDIVTWGGGSDEHITAMIEAHYNGNINVADYWAIGDCRTISIDTISGTGSDKLDIPDQSAQDIVLQIIDFNHDVLESNVGKITRAAITVQTKSCLKSVDHMSVAQWYDAYFSNGVDLWTISTRRSWCNYNFINALPTYISSMIRNVVKTHYSPAVDSKYNNGGICSTTDKVFLLSLKEVVGSNSSNNKEFAIPDKQVSQYEYLKTVSNRIKGYGIGNYSDGSWFIRTTREGSDNGCYTMLIYKDGAACDGPELSTSSTKYGIAPAFCL